MQSFSPALRLFFLGLATCLSGCKPPILITDYQQAAPLAGKYTKEYSPNKKPRGWYGPPPVVSLPLRRVNSWQAIVLGHVDALESESKLSSQPGARVFVRQQFTDTDSQGNYTLLLAPGSYTLRCGTVGLLQALPVTLRVRPGDSIRIDFRLLSDPRPIIHKMP